MEQMEEKNRIISRIISGELKFSSDDIVRLKTGNLPEEKEQELNNLATEIQEVVEQNKSLRKDINENIVRYEKNAFDKLGLLCIEEELRCCHEDIASIESKKGFNLIFGVLMTTIFGVVIPMVSSFLISSLIWSLVIAASGCAIGITPSLLIERKIMKDQKLTKEKIKKLERERFEALGYKQEDMLESDVKKNKNIIKHIYNSKDLDQELETISLD